MKSARIAASLFALGLAACGGPEGLDVETASASLVVCPQGPTQAWCEAACNHEPPTCPARLCGDCVDSAAPPPPPPPPPTYVCPAGRFRAWCEAACNASPDGCPGIVPCAGCVVSP